MQMNIKDWQFEQYLIKIVKVSQEFGMIINQNAFGAFMVEDFDLDVAAGILKARDNRTKIEDTDSPELKGVASDKF
jgi:hypothetical protein